MQRTVIDDVLDRWFFGEGKESIAKDYPPHTRGWISGILRRARKRGDPRAVHHHDLAAGQDGWRRHYQVERKLGKWYRWVFTP
jgi:hypothetical protein